jgi:GNAT superfamily N-acetyltransferase
LTVPDQTSISIQPLPPSQTSTVEAILRSLPDWFGIESAILNYVREAGVYPTYLAGLSGCDDAGFITVRTHRPHAPQAGEIHCMAVRQEFHRRGLGRALVGFAESALRSQGVRYLQVKTMGPSRPNHEYAETLKFYKAMGFTPLEELLGFWDGLPCLILVKQL